MLLHSLPEAFRGHHIHRLASFFRAQRDALLSLTPNRDLPAKVVLLTPGPYNETYFEHAYLARYLGFTLVEGGDLTVRDRRVFIKTLEGLQPVNVVFRRLDDSFCDPLELRGDSFLGVAGLLDAVRAGTVAVANALGSGLIETAAILPFLPALCRRLLDEDLVLPSTPTWWCGEPEHLAYVLDHLDELVVKPAFPSKGREPVFGRKLAARERTGLAAAVRARPEEFVAQAHVELSTAPVWHRHRLNQAVVFAHIAASGDSFVVMRGWRVSSAQEVRSSRCSAAAARIRGCCPTDRSARRAVDAGGSVRLVQRRRAAERVAEPVLARPPRRARRAHRRVLRSFVSRLADQDTIDDSRQVSSLLQMLIGLHLLPEDLAGHLAAELEEHVGAIGRQEPARRSRRAQRSPPPGQHRRDRLDRYVADPQPAPGHARAARRAVRGRPAARTGSSRTSRPSAA